MRRLEGRSEILIARIISPPLIFPFVRGFAYTLLKSIGGFMARSPGGPVLSGTCIWTNFAWPCGWPARVWDSRLGLYIIQSFPPVGAHFCSTESCRIPERGGRRVNISPHVKPRAGKNVSTWVPRLVLASSFCSFHPRTSFSPYLSIFRPGAAPFTGQTGGREYRPRRRGACQNEMDGHCVCSFFLRRIKVANAASAQRS